MRVGIITFHRAKNIGAMLQTYALQTTLSKYFEKCDIIDYRNNSMEYNYKLKKINEIHGIKSKIKHLLTIKKEKNFDINRNEFIKKFYKLSEVVYDNSNIDSSNEIYDAFFTGSDQVWNNKLNYCDMVYYLDFVKNNKKRNSYAASFGTDCINSDIKKKIKKELIKFNKISVREEEGQKIINNLIPQINCDVVLDPTLLLTKDEWNKIDNKKTIEKDKYIFIYTIAPAHDIIKYAYRISKERKLKIVIFNNGYKKYRKMKNLDNLSPIDFINYIKNAELVLTSSFHGFCFSVLYNKDFYYELDYNKNNNNSRLVNLANIFGLNNREIKKIKDFNLKIDYNFVEKKLDDERKKSIDFILNVRRKK